MPPMLLVIILGSVLVGLGLTVLLARRDPDFRRKPAESADGGDGGLTLMTTGVLAGDTGRAHAHAQDGAAAHHSGGHSHTSDAGADGGGGDSGGDGGGGDGGGGGD